MIYTVGVLPFKGNMHMHDMNHDYSCCIYSQLLICYNDKMVWLAAWKKYVLTSLYSSWYTSHYNSTATTTTDIGLIVTKTTYII